MKPPVAVAESRPLSLRALPLPPGVPGRVWLSAMPGRLEPWADFVAAARGAGLTRIVCLNPPDEIAALSPAYRAAIEAGVLPAALQRLPMRDLGLAQDGQAFRAGIATLAAALQHGEVALLHCAHGIGRTGTAAACLLKHLGLPTAEALRQVRAAGSNPESALQSGLIYTF